MFFNNHRPEMNIIIPKQMALKYRATLRRSNPQSPIDASNVGKRGG
jgi:hypothetical protein